MLKNLLSILFPIVLPIQNLINTSKSDWAFIGKKILLLVLPFIVVLSVIYPIMFVFCFISWQLPEKYYFPFLTGGEIQAAFDRLLLLIGILSMIFIKNDE